MRGRRIPDRWRRAAAIAITLIAAAASLATSSMPASVSDVPASGRQVLSEARPEVRIPFEVEATAAALAGRFRVLVSAEPSWFGAGDAVVAAGPDISVETATAAYQLERLTPGFYQLSCGPECLDRADLVMRWPSGANEGTVFIEWSVRASSEFEGSEAPEGAAVTLDVKAPPSDPNPVIAGFGYRSYEDPMKLVEFHVTSTGPLDPDAVFIHRPADSSGATVRVQQGIVWQGLAPQQSLPIELPAECAGGPCKFNVRASLSAGSTSGNAAVGIVAAGSADTVSAVVTEHEPWSSGPATDDRVVSVDGPDRAAEIPLHAEIKAASFAIEPVAWVTVDVDLGEESEDGARVQLSATDRGGSVLASTWLKATLQHSSLSFGLPTECDSGRCTADAMLTVNLVSVARDDFRSAVIPMTATVRMLSPVAVGDPGGVVVEIGDPS